MTYILIFFLLDLGGKWQVVELDGTRHGSSVQELPKVRDGRRKQPKRGRASRMNETELYDLSAGQKMNLYYIPTDIHFNRFPFCFSSFFLFFYFPNLCKSNQDFDTILFQCWLIVYLLEFFVLTYSTVFIFFPSIRNILFACRDKFMRHTFWFPSSSSPISIVSLQCVLFSPPELFCSSSFSFCLHFRPPERGQGRMNDNISHTFPFHDC